MQLQFKRLCVAAACLWLSSSALADIVMAGTRIVYPATTKQVSVRLTNAGKQSSLVQVWTDRSATQSPFTPTDLADAPFLVTPPIFRIDSGRSQTLRLRYAGEALPQDRESVFWLNVLDVPPEPSTQAGEENENYVQLAIRTRLKIFYRPDKLAGSPQATVSGLQWSLVPGTDGNKPVLRVSNPGTYHASFAKIELVSGGQTYPYDLGGMAAPGGHADFPLSGLPQSELRSGMVRFQWLNDYGAIVNGEANLTGASGDTPHVDH